MERDRETLVSCNSWSREGTTFATFLSYCTRVDVDVFIQCKFIAVREYVWETTGLICLAWIALNIFMKGDLENQNVNKDLLEVVLNIPSLKNKKK